MEFFRYLSKGICQAREEIIYLYHVILRGIERWRIFTDAKDRWEFIRRLAKDLKALKVQCYAWVLLSNLHLLLSPTNVPLSDLMRRVLTGDAIYFNRRHKGEQYAREKGINLLFDSAAKPLFPVFARSGSDEAISIL